MYKRQFLTLSLRGYKVTEEEVQQILRFVEGLDIRTVAEQVMQKLFQALAMHYEFSLWNLLKNDLYRSNGRVERSQSEIFAYTDNSSFTGVVLRIFA